MQRVEELKNHALSLMKDGGFGISEEVAIAVDEKLPFMGYTTEKNGKPLIVVAKWAMGSDMLIGLLIHELSHIYRIETHHPSHNFAIHNKALFMALGGRRLLPYQEEILHNILNSLQDLYADDIFFKIKKDIPTNLADFFLSWIHQPIDGSSEKSLWINAGYMVSTAFAQANLERHHVEDADGKVEKEVRHFLARSTKGIAGKFDYFRKTMVHLPEKITEEEFGRLLVDYLQNFLTLTNPK